jgi:DNA invertase Pin-like site-specific DNA recombinase
MASQRAIIWCAVSTKAQAADEKASLPAQEEAARALCADHGWDVIDVLKVPGHSRSYYDYNELADAALRSKLKIDAFHKLRDHWQRGDFDVLVVRDGDRFARSQSLFSRIVEEVINTAGATIWSLADGLIDKHNYRMWISMVGYRAAGDIDRLKKYRADGIVELAKRGIPVNAKPPLSHRLVRDPETGKANCLVVREELRPLFNDLATLLLEGIAFDRLAEELYARYGYLGSDGKPYTAVRIWRMVYSPVFWGNNAIRWRNNVRRRYAYGIWAFDASAKLPDGIEMFFDVTEPVYKGEQAEAVKAELRRRTERYGTPDEKVGKFTSLVICDGCGRIMTYQRRVDKGILYVYLRCIPPHRRRDLPPCPRRGHIREEAVQEWLDKRLREWVKRKAVNLVQTQPHDDTAERIERLRVNETRLEARLQTLIAEQSYADDDLQDAYRKQIRAAKDDLDQCQRQIADLEREHRYAEQRQVQSDYALKEMLEIGVARLWEQSPLYINQFLHQLLGGSKLRAGNGKILGFISRDARL